MGLAVEQDVLYSGSFMVMVMVMVKLMAMVILTKPVWEEASDPLISLVDKKTNLIYLIGKGGQRDQFLHEAITDD